MTEGITRHWWWGPGWQPGSRFCTFHFTFAAQPAVQELAARARERLAPFAWLDPVPGEWLHCTTQGVGFAGDVTGTDLSAIAAAARARLAAVEPATVTVTAPHAAGEGALCDVVPDGNLGPCPRRLPGRDRRRMGSGPGAGDSAMGPARLSRLCQ